MKQVFADGPPRVRQLTADEATILVWKNASAAGILRGGRCGHAAIMMRSDALPIGNQDDIRNEQDSMHSLQSEFIDARQEFLLLGNDISTVKKEIAAFGGGGGMARIQKEARLKDLQEKQTIQEREMTRLFNKIKDIQIWNNPNVVRWYYLKEAKEGFNRHVYISWFPGGDGVNTTSLTEMLGTIPGVDTQFMEDMTSEMSTSTRNRLFMGSIQPRPGQVEMANSAYGFKDLSSNSNTWGQEPDYVISVPAIGASNRYWGVNCSKMWTWWEEFKDSVDADYQMISKTKSCAGIALRAMVQGGSETFSKLPSSNLYVLPNEVAHYAIEVRAGVVDLNTKAARFEFKVLQPWAKQRAGKVPSSKLFELWSASDWRSNRGKQGHTRFSVGDHLEKYHSTDPDKDWPGKFHLLAKIFSYVVSEVGENRVLVSQSDRQDALITLGSQCLNVLRQKYSWVRE